MEQKTKRVRKSADQLLEEAITQLYVQIENKVTKIQVDREVLDELFELLRPLRELEDEYRGTHERSNQ